MLGRASGIDKAAVQLPKCYALINIQDAQPNNQPLLRISAAAQRTRETTERKLEE